MLNKKNVLTYVLVCLSIVFILTIFSLLFFYNSNKKNTITGSNYPEIIKSINNITASLNKIDEKNALLFKDSISYFIYKDLSEHNDHVNYLENSLGNSRMNYTLTEFFNNKTSEEIVKLAKIDSKKANVQHFNTNGYYEFFYTYYAMLINEKNYNNYIQNRTDKAIFDEYFGINYLNQIKKNFTTEQSEIILKNIIDRKLAFFNNKSLDDSNTLIVINKDIYTEKNQEKQLNIEDSIKENFYLPFDEEKQTAVYNKNLEFIKNQEFKKDYVFNKQFFSCKEDAFYTSNFKLTKQNVNSLFYKTFDFNIINKNNDYSNANIILVLKDYNNNYYIQKGVYSPNSIIYKNEVSKAKIIVDDFEISDNVLQSIKPVKIIFEHCFNNLIPDYYDDKESFTDSIKNYSTKKNNIINKIDL